MIIIITLGGSDGQSTIPISAQKETLDVAIIGAGAAGIDDCLC